MAIVDATIKKARNAVTLESHLELSYPRPGVMIVGEICTMPACPLAIAGVDFRSNHQGERRHTGSR